MTFVGTARPRTRWHHASATLDDFVVVTFRVEAERLRRQVPRAFEPTVLGFDDGTEGSLISVVAFVERDFRFRVAPFVRVSGALVDYRAYGTVAGESGVYVFRTSLDHPLVVVPRLLWRMPWRRERVGITSTWDGPGPAHVDVRTNGADGLVLDLMVDGTGPGPLDGFADHDAAVAMLTHPMAGWYRAGDRLHRYSVWHEVLEPEVAQVHGASVPVFRALDLLEGGEPAHSALVVRVAEFDIHTPPRRVR